MVYPKVTIVTVTYNCENDIEETIQSVLSQDYPNFEYIIVDGKSKDRTYEIISRYKERVNRMVSEPDAGLYDAMNKGIKMATGQWVNFMNAGDKFYNEHVISDIFSKAFDNNKYKAVYGNALCVFEDGSSKIASTPQDKLSHCINWYQPYIHQAVFYNINTKEDCYYDLRYKIAADYDVACRYWKKYGFEAFRHVDVLVCEYKGFNGVSSNPKNKDKAKNEALKIKIRNRMNMYAILHNCMGMIKRMLVK